MAQPQNLIADALDRVIPHLDDLARDARLGRPGDQLHFHDLEERMQRIVSALVAPFRGAGSKPVNQPVVIENLGGGRTRARW
ncbi:hypothetical protein BH10PSE14_BH10PSE14_04520 [soil metagenome]